ncbi:hypothetical protein CR513_19963, partial [Mucuna pruriens]
MGQQRSIIHENLNTPTVDRPEVCLEENEAAYIIQEVHEGICGTHIGGRALASKIARAGYYWPTLRRDCMEYVKRCDKCQRFAEGHRAPTKRLHSITSPWLFFKWGVDIFGLLPPTPGQVKFLIVMRSKDKATVHVGRASLVQRKNLDLLQEAQEITHVREYTIKARAARRHDRGVIPRKFEAGDLVLREITQKVETNKLTPAWDGPFRVLEEVGQGAYCLENLDGKKVPRTWNVASLRMYFS